MRSVLHVGCGPKSLKNVEAFFQDGSWSEIRFDIDPSVKPDVLGTLTDLSAIQSGSVSAVISSHNIEHLYWHDVPKALSEFRRVLSADGFLWLRCPNLQGVAKLVAEDKLLDTAYVSGMGPITPLDIIYGHRASVSDGNHFMAHKCGFTKTTLMQSLRGAGFRGWAVSNTEFELFALATAFQVSERQGLELFKNISK